MVLSDGYVLLTDASGDDSSRYQCQGEEAAGYPELLFPPVGECLHILAYLAYPKSSIYMKISFQNNRLAGRMLII